MTLVDGSVEIEDQKRTIVILVGVTVDLVIINAVFSSVIVPLLSPINMFFSSEAE